MPNYFPGWNNFKKPSEKSGTYNGCANSEDTPSPKQTRVRRGCFKHTTRLANEVDTGRWLAHGVTQRRRSTVRLPGREQRGCLAREGVRDEKRLGHDVVDEGEGSIVLLTLLCLVCLCFCFLFPLRLGTGTAQGEEGHISTFHILEQGACGALSCVKFFFFIFKKGFLVSFPGVK